MSARVAAATLPEPVAVAPAARRWLDPLLALAVAAIVVVVFHRATGYFFNSDDFEGLARARGVLPERTGLARLIPWRLWFPLLDRAFGLDPFAYHVASLAVQSASAVLLFFWLRGPAGRWTALVGAAFWAAHPAQFGAVYWVSAIGDPLSILFSLAALLAARTATRVRWAAVPLFALALFSKENVWLVPAVAFLDPGRDRNLSPARRDPVPWILALLSVAMVEYYLATDPIGTRHEGAQAYVPALGPHLPLHLLTYAGWSANFLRATMHNIGNAVDPAFFPAGGALIAMVVAATLWPAARQRGALAGAVLWAAMLAPVLPLPHHIYRYYLCGPLAGVAMVMAATHAAFVDLRPHRSPTRLALAASAVLLAGLIGWNGWALVRDIESAPFMIEGMRAHAVVDRARVAANVAASLRRDAPPPGVTLRFWSPQSRRLAGLPDSIEKFGYWEQNVRSAVLDSVGVRVLFPTIERVEFVPRFIPGGDSVWYAVYQPDGSLRAGPAMDIERALEALKAKEREVVSANAAR